MNASRKKGELKQERKDTQNEATHASRKGVMQDSRGGEITTKKIGKRRE